MRNGEDGGTEEKKEVEGNASPLRVLFLKSYLGICLAVYQDIEALGAQSKHTGPKGKEPTMWAMQGSKHPSPYAVGFLSPQDLRVTPFPQPTGENCLS